MSKPPINPDARSLEDAFFARENAKLLEAMRLKADLQERRAALRQVLKAADDELLDRLLALGVNAETALAMMLLPLVRVAWADGDIAAKERAAILQAAETRGLHPGTAGHELLGSWLEHQPSETMRAAWAKYVEGLWPNLTPEERDEFRDRLLGMARGVADAAGGFLGLGSKSSPAERAILDELETETLTAIERGFSSNLVVHAFARTARECGIGDALIGPFFASMRTDLLTARHDAASHDDYVYGSAEVVGLMCLQVFVNAGAPHPTEPAADLVDGARRLGAAFQDVNFLRDQHHDEASLGRDYLGLGSGMSNRVDVLDRIDADLAAAAAVIPRLPADCR